MAWLITGGAGYIGAHIVRAFRQAGLACVVLDDLSTGLRERVPADVPLVVGSVLDAALLDRLFSEHDIHGVVHLAGKKSVPESVREPELYEQVNVEGTRVLLGACKRFSVRYFVFSSTAAVYGGVVSDVSITEDVVPVTINPYGQTKLDAEQLVAIAAAKGRLQAIAFRYFNVAGAAAPELEDTHGENLLPIVYRALAAGEPVRVFGTELPTRDGSCVRDYVHVVDVAEAHLAGARYLEAGARQGFEVINLGTGAGATVLEVLGAVGQAVGAPVPWVAAPPRAGDPVALTCDASRARELLGWQARLGLDDIVEVPNVPKAAHVGSPLPGT